MKITWVLVFTLCHIDFLVSRNDHKPLMFNLKKNPSLIFFPEESTLRVPCNTWAIACPAETLDEKKFNDIYSLYNAALFLKKIYNENDFCANIPRDRCKEPYKLSIAWFEEKIEFGYEIYFEYSESVRSRFDINHASVYDNYEPLKDFLPEKSRTFMDKLKSTHAMRRSSSSETKLMLRGTEMKFIWIPSFKLWFDMNQLKKIEYQIRKDNVYPILQCQDYSIGQELIIHNADVDKMYSREHQTERLRGLSIYGCEQEFKCFTKWLLLPSDQFRFGSDLLSNPKCSNLATVPIWKKTLEKILQKLDEYLFTLSRVAGEPLRVVAGVSGVLQLPHSIYVHSKTPIRLVDDITKFSIRVPNIFYKLVRFKTNKFHTNHDSFWFGVMIVIHNDPHYDGKEKLCKDITDEWGWSEIKFESYQYFKYEEPSKFIYACKVTRASVEAVGLTFERDMFVEGLQLNDFSVHDRASGVLRKMDVTVNQELWRNHQLRGSFITRYEVIERPPIYDEEFDVSR